MFSLFLVLLTLCHHAAPVAPHFHCLPFNPVFTAWQKAHIFACRAAG